MNYCCGVKVIQLR